MTTTIQISNSQWKILSSLKKYPRETFIDVIERLLKKNKTLKEKDLNTVIN